jgi:c-di-GMP-binding flagellar brake protein YcgR
LAKHEDLLALRKSKNMKISGGRKSRVGILNLERRKHPRFSIDLPVEYERVDSSVYLKGRAIDASEGGLLIVLPERVEIGRHLRLKLFLSVGLDLETVEALTQVVWVEMCSPEKKGDFRSGVKLIDISGEDLRKLKEFLEGLAAA